MLIEQCRMPLPHGEQVGAAMAVDQADIAMLADAAGFDFVADCFYSCDVNEFKFTVYFVFTLTHE